MGRREVLGALGFSALGVLAGVGSVAGIGSVAEAASVGTPSTRVILYGPDGRPLPAFTVSDPGRVQDVGRNGSLGVLLDHVTTKGPGPAFRATGAEALVTIGCRGAFMVRIEGSKGPGKPWYTAPCIRLDDGSYAVVTTARDSGSYAVDIGGWSMVRANCTYIDKSPLTVD